MNRRNAHPPSHPPSHPPAGGHYYCDVGCTPLRMPNGQSTGPMKCAKKCPTPDWATGTVETVPETLPIADVGDLYSKVEGYMTTPPMGRSYLMEDRGGKTNENEHYYGNPANGCKTGEERITVFGHPGEVCAFFTETCTEGAPLCPPAPPDNNGSYPFCVYRFQEDNMYACGLICEFGVNGKKCPDGMTCTDNVCTWV